MTLVAGVDTSTQSCKVVIRDAESGHLVRQGRAGHPAGTEIDPAAWWAALVEAVADAGGLSDVAAVAVAGQQHGMVVLDADGCVIRPALLWNDTRSAKAASDLIDEVGADEYARRTGTVPVASFTATKLRWLRDAEPSNAERVAAVALPHDWLTWRLRGFGPAEKSPLGPVLDELVTDRSDASGTAYWSPVSEAYDFDLFELALGRQAREASPGPDPGSGRVILPRVLGPADRAGIIPALRPATPPTGNDGQSRDTPSESARHTASDLDSASSWEELGLREGTVVGPGAGDNAGAALGLGAAAGDVVVSIGTSGTVFAVTDEPVADTSGTVAGFADAGGLFLPLVATLNAARVLGSIAGLLDIDHDELGHLALDAEPGAGGIVLVPYFEGERTPNLPDATASLRGMTIASTTRPNLSRAAIEGMLCGLAAGLDAVRDMGVTDRRIMLIGGAAQNPAVQQIAAQVFDAPVVVPSPGEYVADGAAAQAAWVLTGDRPHWTHSTVAEPAPDTRAVIREQYARVARED